MDETPTWFNAPISKTVDFIGAKVVPIKVAAGDRKRVTTILTVTEEGKILPPCIIEASQSKLAKERPGDTRYLRHGITFYKQPNNTNTCNIMIDWIKNYLVPLFPFPLERKLLILDSATCHLTEEVKETLHSNLFDLLVIPTGCTKYLQPLDLTVNRSFKAKLKGHYVDLLKTMGEDVIKVSRSRLNMDVLAKNILKTTMEITPDCIRNGWRVMKG
jgi:hypothetical protein